MDEDEEEGGRTTGVGSGKLTWRGGAAPEAASRGARLRSLVKKLYIIVRIEIYMILIYILAVVLTKIKKAERTGVGVGVGAHRARPRPAEEQSSRAERKSGS